MRGLRRCPEHGHGASSLLPAGNPFWRGSAPLAPVRNGMVALRVWEFSCFGFPRQAAGGAELRPGPALCCCTFVQQPRQPWGAHWCHGDGADWIYGSQCAVSKQDSQGFGMPEEQGQELGVRLDIRRCPQLSAVEPGSWLSSCSHGVLQESSPCRDGIARY